MPEIQQGFVIRRNLEENTNDRNALNNLGTSPIADDIALFKNNKRNVSTLTVLGPNIDTSTNYIRYNDRDVVFTNGTKITNASGAVFYVKNSNGINQFQLSTNPDLLVTLVLDNSYIGTYTRSDEITGDNIRNLKLRRRPVLLNRNDDAGAIEDIVEPFSANVKEKIEAFEYYYDNFRNLRNNSIIRNKNFTTDLDFLNNGHVTIQDPDNYNVTFTLTASAGPGIFIYNPVSGSKIRAFSDTQNVWKESVDTLYLETTANTIVTGTLTLTNTSITIQRKAGSTQPLTIQGAVSPITTSGASPVFTHKVKTTINGEEYFLCLSNSATVP